MISYWIKSQAKSLRALFWLLPLYAAGVLNPHRHHSPPTFPRLLLGERRWTSRDRWTLPGLCVRVMDVMGEHYGYPRHAAYLLIWWNRRGYAWGVEFSTNTEAS